MMTGMKQQIDSRTDDKLSKPVVAPKLEMTDGPMLGHAPSLSAWEQSAPANPSHPPVSHWALQGYVFTYCEYYSVVLCSRGGGAVDCVQDNPHTKGFAQYSTAHAHLVQTIENLDLVLATCRRNSQLIRLAVA